jgi:hypothetical protein
MGGGLPGTATKSRWIAIHPTPFEDKSGAAASADAIAQAKPTKTPDIQNVVLVDVTIIRLPLLVQSLREALTR